MDIDSFSATIDSSKTEPIINKLINGLIDYEEKTYEFADVCVSLREYLSKHADTIVPPKSYSIYCEQMGDTELSDTKFVEESRNLFAMIPASHKSVLSCILHFFIKVSRLIFYEEGDKLLSEIRDPDEKVKGGEKPNVNKKILEKLTNVFGPIIFKAQSNTGSNDVSAASISTGKEAGHCFRIATLIDRIERPFKPPTLDVSGDEAPLPSKPYAWFNSTLSAAEGQAGLEGSASGTFFVMRNEENLSEYKLYFVNSAGNIGSIGIVKTINGCWKKADDDFAIFVSLRSLVEYFVSIGFVKTPFVTNSNSIPMNTDSTSDGVPPSSPTPENAVVHSSPSSSKRKEGSSSSSKKKHSSSSSSSKAVAGDSSQSAKSGDGSAVGSSKKHHKQHSHKHKSKKSKDGGGNEAEEEEEEQQEYDFDLEEVPPLGPRIKPQ